MTRGRSIRPGLWLAVPAIVLVILFYVVTIVKLGPGVMKKSELPAISVLA